MTPNADGPDISHYQVVTGPPRPEWKVFSLKCTEGATSVDKTFARRWEWLRTQPSVVYRGAYHWLRSDASMQSQANNLVSRINAAGGLQVGEFVQTDWETTPNVPNLTVAQVVEFNDRVRQAFGRDCLVTYSSEWVPGFVSWRYSHPDEPLWYAAYNQTTGWQACQRWNADLWQWTSTYKADECIRSGNNGGFDMNHIIKEDTLRRVAGYTSQEIDMSKVFIHNGVRIFDSRTAGAPQTAYVVAPHGYTPKDAIGIFVNVAVVDQTSAGVAVLYGPDPKPDTATVNYVPGDVGQSFTMVPLDATGHFKVALTTPAHVIIDQVGLSTNE